jgi:capsular exopolysaccharide synthesis family protein
MSQSFELLRRAGQETAPVTDDSGLRPQPAESSLPLESEKSASALPEISGSSREQVAKLVRHLFLSRDGARVVVLAAVEPGNGGSWMAVQCARILAAQATGSVCIVDANLRTPALHRFFAVANHYGLSDAIRQPAPVRNFLSPVPWVRNLWLMSCGSITGPEAQPLMASGALRSRISELRAAFDYVVIDAPPLSLFGDALVLGQLTDGVALVVAEQDTRKGSARHAVEELSKANVRVLGAVLNKRTFPIPQEIYDRL